MAFCIFKPSSFWFPLLIKKNCKVVNVARGDNFGYHAECTSTSCGYPCCSNLDCRDRELKT